MASERDELLTVDEVAKWLRVNPQTVRNWLDRGELRAVHAGARRVRIRQSELDRFLSAAETTGRADPPEPPVPEGEPLAGAISAVFRAQDPIELVAALRALAAAADRLAAALESHAASDK